MNHLEAAQIRAAERYLAGELPSPLREAYEQHFLSCPQCAQVLRAEAVFAANLRAVLRTAESVEPRAALRLKPIWRRPAVLIPYAACALLLIVSGYQRSVLIPGIRSELAQATRPQALLSFPVVASRGPEAFVVSKESQFFSLFLDPPPDYNSPSYLCEVRSDAGTVKFNLRVPAPPPGEPLRLLLRAADFPAGPYVLSVRGDPGREALRYPLLLAHK